MGRLTAGRGDGRRTTTTSNPGYKPGRSYSYGSAGSKANRADARAFADQYNKPSPGAQESLRRSLGRSGAYGVPGRPPRLSGGKAAADAARRAAGRGAGLAGSLALQLMLDIFEGVERKYWEENWSEVASAGYNFDQSGWTFVCSGDGNPPWIPPPGVPVQSNQTVLHTPSTCVAGNWPANVAYGDPIGTTIRAVLLGIRGLPGPGGFFREPVEVWNRDPITLPEPAFRAVPLVISLGDLAPEPAQSVEQASGPVSAGSRTVEIRFNDGGSGGVRNPPTGPDRPRPPAPNERERKWKLGKGGIVGDIFGTITEIGDAAACAASAAGGKNVRGLSQQIAYVAKNFDVGNPEHVAAFIKCMALNNLKDIAIGKANRAAGKAFGEASGAPRGPGIKRGPSVF